MSDRILYPIRPKSLEEVGYIILEREKARMR